MYFTNENSTYKAQRLLKICLFALLPGYNLLYMCVNAVIFNPFTTRGDQQGISLYNVQKQRGNEKKENFVLCE